MKKTSLYLLAPSSLLLVCLLLFSFASVSESAVEYKVKKGDSFYSIAKKYHVKISDLKNANTAARDMKPGDKLIVPSKNKAAQKITRSDDPERDNVSYKKPSGENITPDKSTGPSQSSAKDIYHTVKKGDTLSSISHKYSISVIELRELNELRKSSKLKNGQKLLVKSAGPKIYTVKKGDNIWKIAKKYNIDAEELMEINEMDSPSLKKGKNCTLKKIRQLYPNSRITRFSQRTWKKN